MQFDLSSKRTLHWCECHKWAVSPSKRTMARGLWQHTTTNPASWWEPEACESSQSGPVIAESLNKTFCQEEKEEVILKCIIFRHIMTYHVFSFVLRLENTMLHTIITPIWIPWIGNQPIRCSIFNSPAQDSDSMATQKISSCMLVNTCHWTEQRTHREWVFNCYKILHIKSQWLRQGAKVANT